MCQQSPRSVYLNRSLELTTPDSSILRKLYDLLATAHRQSGQPEEALAWCRKGLAACADDLELLLHQGMLLWDAGKRDDACDSLTRLLAARPAPYFASMDAGLRGYKTRHLLAGWYRKQRRIHEAEVQWRAAVADNPAFGPAWLGLGDLLLQQGRAPEAEQVGWRLEEDATELVNGRLLRARSLLARNETSSARRLLEEAIAQAPKALGLRVLLTYALLRDGSDLEAAEAALRAVLALAPDHKEARHNLDLLLRKRSHRSARAKAALVPAGCENQS